jgi:hypothetical protein
MQTWIFLHGVYFWWFGAHCMRGAHAILFHAHERYADAGA